MTAPPPPPSSPPPSGDRRFTEDELRRMLAARAESAEAAAPAERVRDRFTRNPRTTGRRAPRRWVVPAAAAALVGALAAAGIAALGTHRDRDSGGGVPVPSATRPAGSLAPNASGGPTRTGGPNRSNNDAPDGGADPFRAVDVDSDGAGHTFVLGSRACGTQRCGSVVDVSADVAGAARPTPAAVSVPDRLGGTCDTGSCVNRILTVSATVVYLYGPATTYVTTDAGRHWRALSGGARALTVIGATHGPTVLKVTVAAGRLAVALAEPGGDWRVGPAPDAVAVGAIRLTGGAAGAIMAVDDALYVSTADGQSWQAIPTRCPRGTLRALAVDRTGWHLVIGCGPATGARVSLELYRVDYPGERPPSPPGALGRVADVDPASLAVGDAAHAVIAGSAVYYRRGATWARAPVAGGSDPGVVTFTGAQAAVYLGGAGGGLALTADGGANWHPVALR